MLETIDQSGLDKIKFSNSKTQVAFFDSCSSYAHYVDMYSKKKKNNLHIMSYGSVSLFEAAPNTMGTLLDVLVSPQAKEVPWKKVLHKIEVSHLEPVLGLIYSDPDAQLSRYKSRGLIPSFLLNVHAP